MLILSLKTGEKVGLFLQLPGPAAKSRLIPLGTITNSGAAGGLTGRATHNDASLKVPNKSGPVTYQGEDKSESPLYLGDIQWGYQTPTLAKVSFQFTGDVKIIREEIMNPEQRKLLGLSGPVHGWS